MLSLPALLKQLEAVKGDASTRRPVRNHDEAPL
jgi:hypothetical protein